jgi:hypothetical protein
MKTFDKIAAQGDAMIKRVDTVPEGYTPSKAVNGKHIVAHSETGHHHTVLERNAQLLINQTNEFIAYLKVDEDTELKHERRFDTHESLLLKKGVYEIRRQREYTPAGYRRAAD